MGSDWPRADQVPVRAPLAYVAVSSACACGNLQVSLPPENSTSEKGSSWPTSTIRRVPCSSPLSCLNFTTKVKEAPGGFTGPVHAPLVSRSMSALATVGFWYGASTSGMLPPGWVHCPSIVLPLSVPV